MPPPYVPTATHRPPTILMRSIDKGDECPRLELSALRIAETGDGTASWMALGISALGVVAYRGLDDLPLGILYSVPLLLWLGFVWPRLLGVTSVCLDTTTLSGRWGVFGLRKVTRVPRQEVVDLKVQTVAKRRLQPAHALLYVVTGAGQSSPLGRFASERDAKFVATTLRNQLQL